MKQLRLDTVKFLGWCRPGKIPLSYFRQLGLNQLTATTSEEMKGIADTDMLGNWFLNNTMSFRPIISNRPVFVKHLYKKLKK